MTIKQHGGIFGRNPTFNSVTTGSAIFGDNDKAIFGNGSDLQIYHDGGNSFISETGVGSLRLQGTNLQLQSSAGVNYLQGINSNRVDVYYDGSIKLTTTSTGVSVTGNVSLPAGNGIDFSATSGTGTSELFDDYEEGDHEVSVTAGTSGTITVGASSSILSYTKVGRQVTVMGRILIGSVSSPVGALKVSLPFVIGNMAEFGGYVFNTNHFYGNGTGVSDGASYYTYAFSGTEGQSTISLLAISRAGIFDTTAADWLGANSEIYVNFTYFTS